MKIKLLAIICCFGFLVGCSCMQNNSGGSDNGCMYGGCGGVPSVAGAFAACQRDASCVDGNCGGGNGVCENYFCNPGSLYFPWDNYEAMDP